MNTLTVPQASATGTHYKPLLLFMLAWFIINLLQATFLGLDGDEAYYWYLSQQLDWGYFDHPPFVALLIQLGETFGHGPFFTRLGTALITTLSAGMIFWALPDTLKNLHRYLWLFAATLLFNVYSFITTPDAPLLFFSAVFFYGYKRYLSAASVKNSLIMAAGAAGMFYSKYHGILPVIFVVLSNPRLLRKSTFWLMVGIVTVLYLPHLYWQYQHDWPTVRFHLFERAMKKYKVEYTTSYLLGQLLVWGPVISIFFYFHLRKVKATDKLIRAHLFNFLGILLLFLFSSFRNSVQAHWTLVGGCSFIVLFMELLQQGTERLRKTFFTLCRINIILIIIARILFLLPVSPFQKIKNYAPFFYGKEWAAAIHQQAGDVPVLFTDSYIAPSIYRFYHPEVQTFGYNTKTYRKTNFSINNADEVLDGKKVYCFRDGMEPEPGKGMLKVSSVWRPGVLEPIDSFNAISNLKIVPRNLPPTLRAGKEYSIDLDIKNEGREIITNRDSALYIEYSYSPLSYKVEDGQSSSYLPLYQLQPGQLYHTQIKIIAPETAGKNRILFSFRNGTLAGNFASAYYPLKITSPD